MKELVNISNALVKFAASMTNQEVSERTLLDQCQTLYKQIAQPRWLTFLFEHSANQVQESKYFIVVGLTVFKDRRRVNVGSTVISLLVME